MIDARLLITVIGMLAMIAGSTYEVRRVGPSIFVIGFILLVIGLLAIILGN